MKSSASALHIKATRFITGNRRPLWLAPSLTSEYGLPDLDFRCRLPDLHCKPLDLIRGQNAPPQQPVLTGARCGERAVYGLTFELGLGASGFKFRLPVLDFRIWTSGFKLPELGPGAFPFATAKPSASALCIKATRFINSNDRRPLWLAPSPTSECELPDLDFRI